MKIKWQRNGFRRYVAQVGDRRFYLREGLSGVYILTIGTADKFGPYKFTAAKAWAAELIQAEMPLDHPR